ncbi:6-phosphogluconolactonase [Leifsonia sp. H3M29-4]|uniref:6-phosphogluconolactonase n=1 Tax=Salinibacterium metalliresistens TaxID=3031321 RepID=UPI0023D9ED29|nr:6-phosphogluconolactonase [Salinibacterium metalliresistens]MDF1479873.1 6-phosphogluconolactonase [Salinibacterium metalliresistens]
MSNERRVIVHNDKNALAAAVAARFIAKTTDLIEEFDEASVVLTGGTMGSAVLEAINNSPARDLVDWSRVNVWWGDERWLPTGDPERNETQARAALLDHVGLDPARVHPMAASDSGLELDDASAAYAATLAAHAPRNAELPHFDITFLGMGPDGHIASLFPERGGIRDTEHTVISVRNSPKPPPERISLTLRAINSSARVWMVVAGVDKASALGLTLAGASINEVPAAGVEGRRKTLFFVDAEAAAEVPENLIHPGEFWTRDDG